MVSFKTISSGCCFLLCLFTLTISNNVNAQPVQLPHFFSSNMVLQRQKPIVIWGTARANYVFQIAFAGKNSKVVTGKDGKWQAVFPAMPAGGPYDLVINADSSYTLRNIMIGDVWLCSGQSNMEWIMLKTFNAPYELQHAGYPAIRFITVPKNVSAVPKDDIDRAEWKISTPATAYECSAVAFFFAKRLYEKYKVPIGIIHSSWGGTPIEAWTGFDSIASQPGFKEKAAVVSKQNAEGKTVQALQALYADSLKQYQSALQMLDRGYVEKWYGAGLNPSNWGKISLPALFTDTLTSYKGSIWLRRSFYVPPMLAGKDLILNLETLNERDITWFNGIVAGSTSWAPGRRTYRIPKAFVHEGENNIAIRLENFEKISGFQSKNAADLRIEPLVASDRSIVIPLAGEWRYATGLSLDKYPHQVTAPPLSYQLAALYNAMIAPFKDLGLKGFTWYQGEANAGRAFQYRKLLPLMINNWRQQFNQGDLPFLYVQLAGFGKLTGDPVESEWAELREAQEKTLSLANTGMAVTVDAGNPYDVHPTDKQTVGKRLAAAAEKMAYGDTALQISPLYQSCRIQNDTIYIKVNNVRNGLIARGAMAKGFSIAGSDHRFVWADAVIRNNEIVVWNKSVSNPLAVRYAWTGSPVESNGANIYNKEGFPLSPFRTDDWKGITEDRK
ncbi:sialate O-acetylesterase [Danxiaibacter flavus]|uniref:Sialate O-acetylesterase n=1 Tax=Danxiaibacter flavus TaxID=3049108 RepID=A0ABV3ZL71_9BACT|nr:sialate O-acetylesterase [Chitinophagaceae bacterium DXS]